MLVCTFKRNLFTKNGEGMENHSRQGEVSVGMDKWHSYFSFSLTSFEAEIKIAMPLIHTRGVIEAAVIF